MTELSRKSHEQRIIAFLSDPASYPDRPLNIDIRETHGARVFLAGDYAYKVKKPIRLPYLDFSTLEKRAEFCRRELEINRPAAPDLYLGVIPITREGDGRLAFAGAGPVIEWVLQMKRFPQEMLFDQLPREIIGERATIESLADAVISSHLAATPVKTGDGPRRIEMLIRQLSASFTAAPDIFDAADADRFTFEASAQLTAARLCLRFRGRAGYIRRCHGDLHLRNILLLDGRAVLFDALEFDEELATIDTLYDLAFLLMDFHHRDMAAIAVRLLNRYLYLSGAKADIYGLKALALFLALRAGIRAMVNADLARQKTGDEREAAVDRARGYFQAALQYLHPPAPFLIAVGGFSGTGKTTLAAALAERLALPFGCLHFRTDLERKAMFNVTETERLPAGSYTRETSDKVYARVLDKARIALKSGQRVVVDAVFSTEAEREAVEKIARRLNIPFTGLWLDADEATLAARVTGRRNDASDATADVVRQQLARGAGTMQWRKINAGGSPQHTLDQALSAPFR